MSKRFFFMEFRLDDPEEAREAKSCRCGQAMWLNHMTEVAIPVAVVTRTAVVRRNHPNVCRVVFMELEPGIPMDDLAMEE